jgi:DNA mismatch repair protein MutS
MNPFSPEPLGYFILNQEAYNDLEFEGFFKKIFPGRQESQALDNYFRTVPLHRPIIQERQRILQDLFSMPETLQALIELLPKWQAFSLSHQLRKPKGGKFVQALGQVRELIQWTELVLSVQKAFTNTRDFSSEFFKGLTKEIGELLINPLFQTLVQHLPELKEQSSGVRSVTVGLNLDPLFKPVGATLLSFSSETFVETAKNPLARLFGQKGLSGKVYEPPKKKQSLGFEQSIEMDPDLVGWAIQPESMPLFQEMGQLLERSSKKLLRGTKKYEGLNRSFWAEKYPALNFFLRIAGFYQRKEKEGVLWSFPELVESNEPLFQGKDLHHPLFTLAGDVKSVPNDIDTPEHGAIQIITGPNRGGKTVYLQTLGMSHILGQMGLPVFGRSCRLSPVQSCQTHFPREESSQNRTGRFGEEIRRLAQILERFSSKGLILLNEPFTSTNASEASEIARDCLLLLAKRQSICFMTTHFLDLPMSLEKENKGLKPPIFSSMVSQMRAGDSGSERTFKVIPGRPQPHSFARELAKEYGLDFSALGV